MYIPYRKTIILVVSFLALPYSVACLHDLPTPELVDALLTQTPQEQSASLDGLSEETKATIKEALINKYRVELTSPLVFQLHQLRKHNPHKNSDNMVRSVAFSSDGKHAIIEERECMFSTQYQWDLTTGKCIKSSDPFTKPNLVPTLTLAGTATEAHPGTYITVFNVDSTRAFTASEDYTIRLWHLSENSYTTIPIDHNSKVTEVAFSPDGKTVLIAFYRTAPCLLDSNTGKCIKVLSKSSKTFITALAISPNGKTALATDENHHFHLWDLNTGQRIKTVRASNVSAIAFSPDAKTALANSSDRGKVVCLWNLPCFDELTLEQLLFIARLSQAPINLDNKQTRNMLGSFSSIIDIVTKLPVLDYHKNPLIKAYIDFKRRELLDAAAHDNVATVIVLIERGFNFNTCDKAGNNLWHYAFKGTNSKPSEKVLEFLLSLKGHVQGVKQRNSAGLPAFAEGILHHREFMLAFLNKYYIPASPDSTNSNAPVQTTSGNKRALTPTCTIQ